MLLCGAGTLLRNHSRLGRLSRALERGFWRLCMQGAGGPLPRGAILGVLGAAGNQRGSQRGAQGHALCTSVAAYPLWRVLAMCSGRFAAPCRPLSPCASGCSDHCLLLTAVSGLPPSLWWSRVLCQVPAACIIILWLVPLVAPHCTTSDLEHVLTVCMPTLCCFPQLPVLPAEHH